MNGKEWLKTIGELGSSVWENVALPKGYWNKEAGYDSSTIHAPPTLAGVSDGVVEEVTGYQQLVKLGYDVATKSEVRTGLWNAVKNISPESIKNAAVNFYEEKKKNYASDKPYIVRHTVGKDAVAVTTAILGLGAVATITDGVKKVGEEIGKKAGKGGNEIAIQFGKTANQIYHTFRHTDALGLDRSLVQSTIQNHFKTISSQVVVGKPFNQIIEIGGQRIQYTAFKLSDGTFNIGRIHGIK